MKYAIAFVVLVVHLHAAFAQIAVSGPRVALAWTAPVNSGNLPTCTAQLNTGCWDLVAGYDVFRAVSGSSNYVQVNATTLTSTGYVDAAAALTWSTIFDYIAESVDASGVKSSPSNTAVVPVPAAPSSLPAPTLTVHP